MPSYSLPFLRSACSVVLVISLAGVIAPRLLLSVATYAVKVRLNRSQRHRQNSRFRWFIGGLFAFQ